MWRKFYFQKLLDSFHQIQLILNACQVARSRVKNTSSTFWKQMCRPLNWKHILERKDETEEGRLTSKLHLSEKTLKSLLQIWIYWTVVPTDHCVNAYYSATGSLMLRWCCYWCLWLYFKNTNFVFIHQP